MRAVPSANTSTRPVKSRCAPCGARQGFEHRLAVFENGPRNAVLRRWAVEVARISSAFDSSNTACLPSSSAQRTHFVRLRAGQHGCRPRLAASRAISRPCNRSLRRHHLRIVASRCSGFARDRRPQVAQDNSGKMKRLMTHAVAGLGRKDHDSASQCALVLLPASRRRSRATLPMIFSQRPVLARARAATSNWSWKNADTRPIPSRRAQSAQPRRAAFPTARSAGLLAEYSPCAVLVDAGERSDVDDRPSPACAHRTYARHRHDVPIS